MIQFWFAEKLQKEQTSASTSQITSELPCATAWRATADEVLSSFLKQGNQRDTEREKNKGAQLKETVGKFGLYQNHPGALDACKEPNLPATHTLDYQVQQANSAACNHPRQQQTSSLRHNQGERRAKNTHTGTPDTSQAGTPTPPDSTAAVSGTKK